MSACGTQWRTGFSGLTGLDYTAVTSIAGTLGIVMDKALLRKVRVMEAMALEQYRKE